jgi:TonB-dependent starch-binding outer membrane protein SusC
MKKNLRFLFRSHFHDRLRQIMRFSILVGFMTILPFICFGTGLNPGDVSASQPLTVTGTVKDASTGEVLIGVNIAIEGTTTGAVTDVNGKFSIMVPDRNAVLMVSYVGYATQRIEVSGRTVIDVILESILTPLQEVVVTGYGSVRKSDLTGSVSSVKSDQIQEMPLQRVDQAIQGRATGVYVLNTDGAPGGNTMIRIRGLNSINGGNEPLIIVDGLQGADLNQINPYDIESMEILKDASATAIYGSRGANGVILITTKLGKPGKPVIDAGYNIGIQTLARKLPVMNAGDFARTFNKYRMTQTQQGQTPEPEFTDAQIAEFDRTGGTDWQDEVYETGIMHNAVLAISGATDKLKYMISSGYLNHKGILLNSQYNRISLRANLAADITKWVDFGLNYSYTKEDYSTPEFQNETSWTSEVVNNAPRWAPTEPVYDENGNYWRHTSGYGANDTWNPMASAVEPIISNPTYQNNANLFLNFKIIEGLSLKLIGGAQYENGYHRDYYNLKTKYGLSYNGWGNVNESLFERYQNTNILTYDNTFGDHHLTFTGVIEQIYSNSSGNDTHGQDFLVDQLNIDNLAGAQIVSVSSYHSERSLLSYMGRINYVLKDRYLATVSYRADGSSVFGADNKWGYFPSGALAWRLSEESFLRDVPFISELKLRASYGLTGNQGISPYESLASLGSGGDDYNYPWDNQVDNTGFGIASIANPNLKWETTAQADIGLDFSLFEGRLNSTFDIYKKVTNDLLMPRELPGYVGVSTVLDNVGSIENRGLEFMISGDPVMREFRWNTSFNITLNRNEVLDLGEDDKISYRPTYGGYGLSSRFMYLEVGKPFGLINGWKYLGMWSADEEAEARSFGQLPGMPHYADLSGPDGVPDGEIDSYDRTTIGYAYPKYTWGFTNSLTYKGIELTFHIIGSQGNDLLNTLRIRRETFWEGNDPKLMHPWTPENQGSDIEALYDGAWLADQELESHVTVESNTSRWVEDASFVRLKLITLAYSIDKKLLQTIGFTKARFFVSGTNLLTLTKYYGYDPEVAQFPNNDATIGVDLSSYPQAKTITFGVDLTF